MQSNHATQPSSEVLLYWLPLGADGNPAVRWGGRAYEAVVARREHRDRLRLFHSALLVRFGGTSFVVEMTPAWGAPARARGVVAEGAVGLALLGRSRLFRYEIRRWRDGVIADVEHASGRPRELDVTDGQARALLDLVPRCPTPVWGRDELAAGDMWNSNSLVAWLLTHVGLHGDEVAPPVHGRAPGWDAGVRVAKRQREHRASGPLTGSEASPWP